MFLALGSKYGQFLPPGGRVLRQRRRKYSIPSPGQKLWRTFGHIVYGRERERGRGEEGVVLQLYVSNRNWSCSGDEDMFQVDLGGGHWAQPCLGAVLGAVRL